MQINIGTQNKVKVKAVREVLADYDRFKEAEINSKTVNSGVSDQPKSLDEITTGAINRAKKAWNEASDYSIGIESRIMKVSQAQSGYIEFTCSAIFDGNNTRLGFSSGFELPDDLLRIVLLENLSLNDACYKLEYSKNKDLGEQEGIVGILTNGRFNRKTYTKQAIIMSLIHFENK